MLPYLLACYDRQRHVLLKSSGTQSDFRVTIITFAFVAYTEHDFPLVLQRVASELVEQDAIFESRRHALRPKFGYGGPFFGRPRLPPEVVSARLNFRYAGQCNFHLHGIYWEYRVLKCGPADHALGVPCPKWMPCKCGFERLFFVKELTARHQLDFSYFSLSF